MSLLDPQREQDKFTANARERVMVPERQAEAPATEREAEREREKSHESEFGSEKEGREPVEAGRPHQVPVPAPPQKSVQAPKSEAVIEIENILSEGLEDIFLELPPAMQKKFQAEGEVTAAKILVLLQEVKLRVEKVLSLIKDWLKIIPGVNKFFLEQEAKIKTDRLLALRDQRK